MSSIKILGIIFTSDLSCQEHALAVRSKIGSKLSVLHKMEVTLNTLTRAQFYKPCVKPYVDYCLKSTTTSHRLLPHVDYCLTSTTVCRCGLIVDLSKRSCTIPSTELNRFSQTADVLTSQNLILNNFI